MKLKKIKINVSLFIERNIRVIGLVLIALSISLGIFNYYQTKIPLNVNNKYEIRQICDNINGLGDATYLLLTKQDYNNINDLKYEKNIGEDKYKIINKYFKNGDDVMLREFWYFCSLGLMIILGLLGIGVLIRNSIEMTIKNLIAENMISDMIKDRK